MFQGVNLMSGALLSIPVQQIYKPEPKFSRVPIFILFLSLWRQEMSTPCPWQERLGAFCHLRGPTPLGRLWMELTLLHAALAGMGGGRILPPRNPVSVIQAATSLVRSFPLDRGRLCRLTRSPTGHVYIHLSHRCTLLTCILSHSHRLCNTPHTVCPVTASCGCTCIHTPRPRRHVRPVPHTQQG